MLKNIFIILVVFFSLTACSVLETSEATHILSGQTYSATSPENVSIYIQKPDFEYVVIGIIEARGMGFSNEARDQELAIQALKREAATIGANGVIISESTQQIASVSKDGTSTERRIKGLAIRRP